MSYIEDDLFQSDDLAECCFREDDEPEYDDWDKEWLDDPEPTERGVK